MSWERYSRGRCSLCAGEKGKGRRGGVSTALSRVHLTTGRSPISSYFLKFHNLPAVLETKLLNTWALQTFQIQSVAGFAKNQTESQYASRARALIPPQAAPKRHSQRAWSIIVPRAFQGDPAELAWHITRNQAFPLLVISCWETIFSLEAELQVPVWSFLMFEKMNRQKMHQAEDSGLAVMGNGQQRPCIFLYTKNSDFYHPKQTGRGHWLECGY